MAYGKEMAQIINACSTDCFRVLRESKFRFSFILNSRTEVEKGNNLESESATYASLSFEAAYGNQVRSAEFSPDLAEGDWMT